VAISTVGGGSSVGPWAYLTATSCNRMRSVRAFDGGWSSWGLALPLDTVLRFTFTFVGGSRR